jgi:hypothetical protein
LNVVVDTVTIRTTAQAGNPDKVDTISRAAVIAAASFSGCGGYEAPPAGVG